MSENNNNDIHGEERELDKWSKSFSNFVSNSENWAAIIAASVVGIVANDLLTGSKNLTKLSYNNLKKIIVETKIKWKSPQKYRVIIIPFIGSNGEEITNHLWRQLSKNSFLEIVKVKCAEYADDLKIDTEKFDSEVLEALDEWQADLLIFGVVAQLSPQENFLALYFYNSNTGKVEIAESNVENIHEYMTDASSKAIIDTLLSSSFNNFVKDNKQASTSTLKKSLGIARGAFLTNFYNYEKEIQFCIAVNSYLAVNGNSNTDSLNKIKKLIYESIQEPSVVYENHRTLSVAYFILGHVKVDP